MERLKTVTMVRFYLPEASHSARKSQLEKVLRALDEQVRVHEVSVLPAVKDRRINPELRYESVGDILRQNPDPPLIIEFFDEAEEAAETRRLLGTLVPEGYSVFWPATWDERSRQNA
jgi:hypothetical protein